MRGYLIFVVTTFIAFAAKAQPGFFSPYYGGPAYAPAGSIITFHTVAQIWIQPRMGIYSVSYKADTQLGVEVNPSTFGADNWGTTNVDLTITIHSDSPECFNSEGVTFNGYVSSSQGSGSTSAFYSFGPIVFYDSSIVGHAKALNVADSGNTVSFQNTAVGASSESRFHVVLDSPLAKYRTFAALNLNAPFYLNDSIPVDYACMSHTSVPITFKPEAAGKYVDTAIIFDPLTKDSLPLILKGSSYDAGVVSIQSEHEIRIFPNPASDMLQIEGGTTGVVRLFDLLGDEVIEADYNGSGTTLKVSGIPPGVYTLRLGTQSAKVIIAE